TESGAGTTAAGRLDANIWTDQIGRPDVRGLHRTDQPLTRPSPRDASPVAEVTRARLLGQFRARLHGVDVSAPGSARIESRLAHLVLHLDPLADRRPRVGAFAVGGAAAV